MLVNTCEVCGKVFLSQKTARYCKDNSTCRVKASRAKKAQAAKAQAESEKCMVPMREYTMYMSLVQKDPNLQQWLDYILHNYGKDAFSCVLDMALYMTIGEVNS